MAGHFERNEDGGYDFIAKADGQAVHAHRAAFFATGGIPTNMGERVALGFEIGFGFVAGSAAAVGALSLGNKLIHAAAAVLS